MTGQAILSLDTISVYYGAVRAIENISFDVFSGEIVTVIGANGAGKTTTLRAISGLCKCASGYIKFKGESIDETPEEIKEDNSFGSFSVISKSNQSCSPPHVRDFHGNPYNFFRQ